MTDLNPNPTPAPAPAKPSPGPAPAPTPAPAPAEPPAPEPKTFTQAELDNIVKDRLARERKKMPSEEDLAAYKKWQDEQKTAEQKQQDAISAAEKAKTEAERRASAAEARAAALLAGVASDFVDDAIALAQRLTDDNTDISAAIKKVVEKYPAFKGTVPTPTISTGAKTGKSTDAEEINKARAVMGLPPKQ